MFKGALTALITPMRGGANVVEVDLDALCALVDWQIAECIDGLVVCGTTGETPTLSGDEQLQVIKTVVEQTNGRVPVIAGAGANDTQKAIAASHAAAELGVDALLHVSPCYNKPTQRGLIAHFEAIADASSKPVVLYNVPGRTGGRIEPETVAMLADHPNIVALKEASADIGIGQQQIAHTTNKDFVVLSGDDPLCMALTCVGGAGVISVTSNVAPKRVAQMIAAVHAGDLACARALHYGLAPLVQALFCESNPIPIKAASAYLGFGDNVLRLPLTALEGENLEHVHRELARQGVGKVRR